MIWTVHPFELAMGQITSPLSTHLLSASAENQLNLF